MSKFSIDLSKAIDEMDKDAHKKVRATLAGISNLIIKGTPVGDPKLWKNPDSVPKGYTGGALRGAWNASLNTQDLSASKRRKAKVGTSIVAKATRVANKLEFGDTFFLTNPLPYALRVENGWSKQRPKGMVAVAIAQAQQVLNKL